MCEYRDYLASCATGLLQLILESSHFFLLFGSQFAGFNDRVVGTAAAAGGDKETGNQNESRDKTSEGFHVMAIRNY